MSRTPVRLTLALMLTISAAGCTTTQKTPGAGLRSVVAQNVVRIACVDAFRDADLSMLSGKPVELDLTGFVDDENRGILDLMARSRIEGAGGRVADTGSGELVMELAALAAGNDHGASRIPLIRSAERSEGAVDLNMTIRDARTGNALSAQSLQGMAKYEQRRTFGFETKGRYYLRNDDGKFVRVPDPGSYR